MGEARLDVERFRELLREEHERLEQVRDAVLEETALPSMPEGSVLGELSDVDQHPADVGTETFEREKQASILDATERQLADVERAQSRLEDGSYGTCEACGRAIPTRGRPIPNHSAFSSTVLSARSASPAQSAGTPTFR